MQRWEYKLRPNSTKLVQNQPVPGANLAELEVRIIVRKCTPLWFGVIIQRFLFETLRNPELELHRGWVLLAKMFQFYTFTTSRRATYAKGFRGEKANRTLIPKYFLVFHQAIELRQSP